ncbi:MAG: CoA transferase, partial [Desulfarculaceae bacterium]|nr:CoA transferase [Desulfarculaceae bacterium]
MCGELGESGERLDGGAEGHRVAPGTVLALVEKCDVVAENFSPRVLENWGVTYPVLKQAKPDIILLRLSA